MMKKNQSGFSLIQLMIALGLSGGLGLFVMMMQKNIHQVSDRMEVAMDVRAATRQMSNFLSRPDDCTATLTGGLGPFSSSPETPVNHGIRRTIVNKTMTPEYKWFFKPGDPVAPQSQLFVKSLVFTQKDDSKYDTPDVVKREVLRVTFVRAQKMNNGTLNQSFFGRMLGSSEIVEDIPIYRVSGECYSVEDDETIDPDIEQKACESIGGKYVVTENPKCRMIGLPKTIVVPDSPGNSECGDMGPDISQYRRCGGSDLTTSTGQILIQCCQNAGANGVNQGGSPISPTLVVP